MISNELWVFIFNKTFTLSPSPKKSKNCKQKGSRILLVYPSENTLILHHIKKPSNISCNTYLEDSLL